MGKWSNRISKVLKKHGPMRSGDLIAALRFDVETTCMDVDTRFTSGLAPLRGSFCDSNAQRVLESMVESGEVVWQRSANMDNWYKLPDQAFSEKAAPRKRRLRDLAREILCIVAEEDRESPLGKMLHSVYSDPCMRYPTRFAEWAGNAAGIESSNIWVEMCPFVLSLHEDGWELADGDPICNWCGNTFVEQHPLDVTAETLVKRMRKKLATMDSPSG